MLDDLDVIKICTGYKYKSDTLTEFPSSLRVLRECEPIYEEVSGWMTPTPPIKEYNILPDNARRYIEHISELLETKISIVSTGPQREQTVLSHTP